VLWLGRCLVDRDKISAAPPILWSLLRAMLLQPELDSMVVRQLAQRRAQAAAVAAQARGM
jgi:hypothetical protein